MGERRCRVAEESVVLSATLTSVMMMMMMSGYRCNDLCSTHQLSFFGSADCST